MVARDRELRGGVYAPHLPPHRGQYQMFRIFGRPPLFTYGWLREDLEPVGSGVEVAVGDEGGHPDDRNGDDETDAESDNASEHDENGDDRKA